MIFFRWLFVPQLATQLAPYQQWECTTENESGTMIYTLCHPEKNIAPRWEEVNLFRWLPFLGDVRAWGELILAPNNYDYVLNKWKQKIRITHEHVRRLLTWSPNDLKFLKVNPWKEGLNSNQNQGSFGFPVCLRLWSPSKTYHICQYTQLLTIETLRSSPYTSSRGPVWRSTNSQPFWVNQLL